MEFCKSLDILFLDDEKAKEILSTTQFEKKIQNVKYCFYFIVNFSLLKESRDSKYFTSLSLYNPYKENLFEATFPRF